MSSEHGARSGGDGRSDEVYTLGVWRVKNGKQGEFVEAWKGLGRFFSGLPRPPGQGTLLQSLDEPRQIYAFGPWRTLDDIQEMRRHPDVPRSRRSERDQQADGPL